MRLKKMIARSMVMALVVVLMLNIAAPLPVSAQQRTCQEAFDACCAVAAVVGPLYYIYCFEGYVFCVRFIKK